jgi:hypothetical protein
VGQIERKLAKFKFFDSEETLKNLRAAKESSQDKEMQVL